ncbi:MAG: hypothetical protein NC517_06695 [Firmicutes bacterium]|nr:hypothetical protein [Bacillota bacterium]
MSRYIKDIQLEQPIDVVSIVMDDFIYHNHFSRTDWNGEMVFYLKDRHNKERYLKWVYVDGQFHVEAWLKNAMGGEMDLDGVGGGASRKEFRESIDGLIETLKKTAAGSLAGGHIGSDPLHHDGGNGADHDTWRQDTKWQQGVSEQSGRTASQAGQTQGTYKQQSQTPPSGQWNTGQYQGNASAPVQTGENRRGRAVDPEANSAMIYAILALIFGWALPVFGIIFVIMSFRKQEYSSNPKRDKTLCIVAIVMMVVGFVGNFAIGIIGALVMDL